MTAKIFLLAFLSAHALVLPAFAGQPVARPTPDDRALSARDYAGRVIPPSPDASRPRAFAPTSERDPLSSSANGS